MDFISISGKEYRVECNFNAIMALADAKGEKDLAFLSGELSMRDWLQLLAASINEGERLEGHSVKLSAEDLGMMSMAEAAKVVGQFIVIFGKQNSAEEKKAEA